MADLLNLARQQTTTTGPGTVVLGPVVTGFISWAAAGAVDGRTYTYGIEQGNQREIGRGVYTAATQELTRTVLNSTNGGAPIELDGTAQVVCLPAAEDFEDLIADHVGESDPHPQYLTEAEGNAAYQPVSAALTTLSTSTSFFLSLSDDANAATARATLGAAAATDLHDPVTLAGTPNYLTIAGQVITRGLVNLASHITGTLGISNGGTGATTAAGARTALNVDVAGTDNSTNVTLAGTPNYLTISGQVITRALINLASHITGTLGIGNGGTGATTAAAARTALAALGVGDFGIGSNAAISNDWDAILESGIYRSTSSAAVGVPFTTQPITMIHLHIDANRATQLAIRQSGNGIWMRRKVSGLWEPWYTIYGSYTTVPVVDGGTGATTAATARSNLGAEATGVAASLVSTHEASGVHTAIRYNGAHLLAFGTDLNSLLQAGFFLVQNPANSPEGIAGYFYVDMQRHPTLPEYLLQTAHRMSTSLSDRWYRQKFGITWGPWQKVFTTHNILGTVSQTSGVPTGGIIERGSNANGEYVRFADGTLICTHQFPSSSSGFLVWTYPVSFTTPPRTVGSVGSLIGDASFFTAHTGSASQINVAAVTFNGAYNPSNRVLFMVAVGRWF